MYDWTYQIKGGELIPGPGTIEEPILLEPVPPVDWGTPSLGDPVPEPATGLLLAIGLIAIARARRR